MEEKRERLSSRLGFILLSVGCAVGLGNVWRFPYIVGQNGGAIFVLIYLFFLAIFGIPIMVMEFSVGRASQKSVARAFRVLEPKGTRWHWFGYFAMVGNYLLMMFYTTIAGWMLQYLFRTAGGGFAGADAQGVERIFHEVQQNPVSSVLWMAAAVLLGFGVCALGLKNGVEKVTKAMMSCLFLIMVALAVHSVTLQGAGEGLSFYLLPDLSRAAERGWWNVVSDAMGQAFFTLSLGVGSMAIFGSYIGKDRRLMGEAVNITALDTLVAFIAGLIIFPACSAFGVDVGQGPSLVFVTLPNLFNSMAGGRVWGTLFFLFLSFAALTTVVAVFENLVSFGMDLFHWTRKKSVLLNIVLVLLLSLPCALGASVFAGFQPFGAGSGVLDLEDFLVSNNFLPLGSLIFLFFCTSRYGWGFDRFLEEANEGKGLRFPRRLRFYVTWILPLLALLVFVQGYVQKFFS
jgi:NSS family neurotransmitter:Na+ symporter